MLDQWREQTEKLFAPIVHHSHIGIAVSGGADSLALMVLAASWAEKSGRQVTVYTLDHGLRLEAWAECALVAEAARGLGLACRILHWDDPKPEAGIQEAARQARYRLIGSAMTNDDAAILLTAHHRNDQAETVLMRLAHGSGLAGLGAMRAFSLVEGVDVFRPLLDLDKSELAKIVVDAGLSAVHDPSNEDTHYERVRWRQHMPLLAELGLTDKRLSRFANRAARADVALSRMAAGAFQSHVQVDGFGVVSIGMADWMRLDDEIAVRVLRSALVLAGGHAKPLALSAVEDLHDVLRAGEAKAQTLSGAYVEVKNERLVLVREVARIPDVPMRLTPGETALWDQRFQIWLDSDASNFVVLSSRGLTRAQLETQFDGAFKNTIQAAHAAPMVLDSAGEIAALGAHSFHPSVQVTAIGTGLVIGH